MKLTKLNKYALRVMLELATANGILSACKIADKQNIPVFFLKKILLKLKNYGLLEVINGKNGGYSIKKQPSEISLKDILVASEDEILLSPCLRSEKLSESCFRKKTCLSRPVWFFINQKIEEAVSSVSLEDILQKNYGKKDGATKK